jgi:hypothetical protein
LYSPFFPCRALFHLSSREGGDGLRSSLNVESRNDHFPAVIFSISNSYPPRDNLYG